MRTGATFQTFRSFTAAASSVSSRFAKQNRSTGPGSTPYRNAEVGIDAEALRVSTDAVAPEIPQGAAPASTGRAGARGEAGVADVDMLRG